MGLTKNYIVNYDIQARVDSAINNIGRLRTAVEQLYGFDQKTKVFRGFTALNKSISDIESKLVRLNELSKTITPTVSIDLVKFDRQLQLMQRSVQGAAAKMRQAIQSALVGSNDDFMKAQRGLSGSSVAKAAQSMMAQYMKGYDEQIAAIEKGIAAHEQTIKNLSTSSARVLKAGVTGEDLKKLKKEADERARKANEDEIKREVRRQKLAKKDLENKVSERAAVQKAFREVMGYSPLIDEINRPEILPSIKTMREMQKKISASLAAPYSATDPFFEKSKKSRDKILKNQQSQLNTWKTAQREWIMSARYGVQTISEMNRNVPMENLKVLADSLMGKEFSARVRLVPDLSMVDELLKKPFDARVNVRPVNIEKLKTDIEAIKPVIKADVVTEDKKKGKGVGTKAKGKTTETVVTEAAKKGAALTQSKTAKVMETFGTFITNITSKPIDINVSLIPDIAALKAKLAEAKVDVPASLKINTEMLAKNLAKMKPVTIPVIAQEKPGAKGKAKTKAVETVNANLNFTPNIEEVKEALKLASLTANVALNGDIPALDKKIKAYKFSANVSLTPLMGDIEKALGKIAVPATTPTKGKTTATKQPAKQATAKPMSFPKLTVAEEELMNKLFATFPKLSKDQETAGKRMVAAQNKMQQSSTEENLAALKNAEDKYGIARKKYIEAFNKLRPLMVKQFQSTATRLLTDEEALKGYEAQNLVSTLSAKKTLTKAQKQQLEKANATLTALRAPAQPAPTTQPTEQKTEVGKGTKGVVSQKQAKTSKAVKGATIDTVANITGVKAVKELTVPVSGEITKVVSKITGKITVPVVGELTKVVKKFKGTTSISVVGNLTKISNKLSSNVSVPVVGKVKIGDIRSQIKGIKPVSLPIMANLKWGKGESSMSSQIKKLSGDPKSISLNLDTKKAVSQLEAFIAKIKASSPQTIMLNTSGTANTPANNASRTKAIVASATTSDKRAAELAKMREDARSVFGKGLTPYEKKLEQQRKNDVAKSIASKQNKAEKLKANLSNSLIPFAQNKEQLNLMVKHRKFFKRAIQSTGIVPTLNMPANEMLTYLQGVSKQMQKASVAVPWQLHNQMNKLQMSIDKANGVSTNLQQQSGSLASRYRDTNPTIKTASQNTGVRNVSAATRQRPVNFYDTARKWSYPFTGNTSFGARTPMAIDMAKGMGVMFAIGGAMSAIGDSFSQAMAYQNTMRTTKAILENGTPSYSNWGFTNMEQTVRDVGVKTKFSAPEVASAARFLAMAGYDINAINNAIRPIADLALIGDTDLGETADKMTNVMTTFKIAPEKMRAAANIMTNTFTKSNTDLMMLAESAKYAGGIAQLYGGNYENNFADVMAMFGVMGNAGIQASSAGTTLRMMYQNLMQPNKNQRKTLQENNIITRDANNRPLEMVTILEQIAKLDKNKIPDVVGKLFRITAQPGSAALLNDLTGGDETLKQQVLNANEWLIGKLSGSTGSKLIDLMASNRESANGTISERIALEKQSTIQGLWAQVTSTFTEGVVKAFEGREGDFTDKLTKLRNYFAKPETVQMIQNLLDMVVSVGETLAWFAKIWANLYNLAPGLVKTWVATQLFFTQIGALISPIVSLIGVLSRLKQIVLGVSGAAAAVSGVSATRTAASMASSAARYSTPASLAAQTASNGLAATTIPAGTRRGTIRVPYTKYVGQSQIYEFPKQSLKGIKAPMTGLTAAQSAATAFIAKDIATWSRSHDYQMGGMPKYERKRLNKTIDRKVAELRGQMPKPQSTVILPPGFGLGYVPLSQSGRKLIQTRYATAAVRPLAIGRYAETVGAVLYGGRTLPQYTEAYKQRADMWKRVAQRYQRKDPETGKILPPIVGSKEYEYRKKVATYSRAAATGMKLRAEHGLYVGESIAMAMQRRAIAKDIARQRHAARGLMGWDASGRMVSRYGFKATAGKAYAMGVNAATTALSFSGLFGNIKSVFQKVGVMLTSFAGALKGAVVALGPWALLAASVVAVGVGWHKFLKGIKEREEKEKNAVRSATDAAEKARNTRYNTGKLLNKKYLGTNVAKASELSNYVGNINAEKNNIAKFYKEYKDVLVPITTTEGMKASNEAWTKALYNHNNYMVAFNTPLNSHLNKNIVGNQKNVTKAQLNASLDESAFVTYFAGQRAAIDESNKQRMADAVTLAGASSNATINAQEQIIELRKKLMNNELSVNNFITQANAIKNATANPKALNLFNAENMTVDDLKSRDWTYSIQYQQGIYNALSAEIEGRIGTISGYLMAENALKNNLVKSSDEWYKAVAKILAMRDGVIEGVQYHISMLPNGQIDFNGILEQLKLKVKDFNLTMEKFAAMTASAYSMLLELGITRDNSYSAYIKFNRQQNKNTPLKKEDYEAYYNQLVREYPNGAAAKSGINAWVADAMNGKNKLTWARRVRNYVSDNAAVRQKREHDKKMPKPNPTVSNTPGANNNTNGGNNGKNGTGNNGKNGAGNNGGNGNTTPNDARDQKQYASHYDRGSARPTHISINIDHLAHFTDTKVVSNAEERDIIAAIEDKISSTLYTIIAEAANRANNIVDRI